MTYPGGKNAVYQKIINQMPPHQRYIEPFLGSGAVMRMKRAAIINIGLDLDERQVTEGRSTIPSSNDVYWSLEVGCGIGLLKRSRMELGRNALIYLDPPYLHSTRRSPRQIYRYELSDDDHERLLSIITELRCYVMISGYWSPMYAGVLADWRCITFETTTRGGSVSTEYLWMNYPEPTELHDYRYLGDDYRQRERIKRKKQRWVKKLQGMDVLERRAILWAIQESGIATNDGAAASSEMAVR